jgi:hypothetical protein
MQLGRNALEDMVYDDSRVRLAMARWMWNREWATQWQRHAAILFAIKTLIRFTCL